MEGGAVSLEHLGSRLEAIVRRAAEQGGEVAVSLRHVQRGQVWEVASEQPFAAASTIKLPILVALYEAADRGELSFAEELVVREEDQVGGAGILRLLSPGARVAVRDLATLMIAVSDNTATNMLLDRLGVERVNATCQRLGLRRTRVAGKLMIVPTPPRGQNTVTAGELTDLLVRMAQGAVVSQDACARMIATLKKQQVNDGLPRLLPPPVAGDAGLGALRSWEWAHKTGSIDRHEHDVGLLFLPGQTVAVSVLTRGLPNPVGKEVLATVGRAVYEAFTGPGADSG